MITIDVFSDPICPWCYIGKKRLDAALAARPDLPVSVRWRAFQLNPDMPRDGMDRQSYLSAKFGGEDRASEVYGQIQRVGAQVGIDFQFDRIPRTPSTLNAHRLIRYAQRPDVDKAEGLMPALFQAYFMEGKDIGDISVLLDIAESLGLNRPEVQEYLNSRAEEDEVQAEDVFARRLGIGGVPCFIIDGKYALSGAQEPEAFLPLLDMAVQEQAAGQSSVEG
ncbi:MAG: DsbA family oxidoreductase [Alphaproteobacteria bacterium]|nr:DsbA family oxidoreductase [Alphaproteobacteria bacterium]